MDDRIQGTRAGADEQASKRERWNAYKRRLYLRKHSTPVYSPSGQLLGFIRKDRAGRLEFYTPDEVL